MVKDYQKFGCFAINDYLCSTERLFNYIMKTFYTSLVNHITYTVAEVDGIYYDLNTKLPTTTLMIK